MKIPESFLKEVREAETAFWKAMEPLGPDDLDFPYRSWSLIDHDRSVVYPPFGFIAFPEELDGDIGNGDYIGYYWPIGREGQDPVVARTSHDVGCMVPTASSFERFRALKDWDRSRDPKTSPPLSDPEVLNERWRIDPDSPYLLTAVADVATAKGDLDRAEALYSQALKLVPEYTAALLGLLILLRRSRRGDEALGFMLKALRSPIAFWGNSFWRDDYLDPTRVNRNDYRRKLLEWIRKTPPAAAGEHAQDPLFQARNRLTFASGVETNDDYPVYDELIDAYIESGRPLASVGLAMLHGELMAGETVSFRERYDYDEASQRVRLMKAFNAAGLTARAEWLTSLPVAR